MKSLLLVLALFICSCGSDTISDLKESQRPSLVICDGNSLTFGSKAENPDTDSYPAILVSKGWNAVNFGIPGQTTEAMLEDAVEQVDSLYEKSAIVIAWEGINSFAKYRYSAEDAYQKMKEYVQGRKQAGFRVAVLTMLPSGYNSHIVIKMNDFQKRYNELVLANSAEADYVIDVAGDVELKDPLNEEFYDAADHVHLTSKGYAVIAESVLKLLENL